MLMAYAPLTVSPALRITWLTPGATQPLHLKSNAHVVGFGGQFYAFPRPAFLLAGARVALGGRRVCDHRWSEDEPKVFYNRPCALSELSMHQYTHGIGLLPLRSQRFPMASVLKYLMTH